VTGTTKTQKSIFVLCLVAAFAFFACDLEYHFPTIIELISGDHPSMIKEFFETMKEIFMSEE